MHLTLLPHIFIPGVQKELDQWPVLLELACLLPSLHVHLVLVSPEVPSNMAGRSAGFPAPHAARCGNGSCSCSHALGPAEPTASRVRGPVTLKWTSDWPLARFFTLQTFHGLQVFVPPA